MGRLHDGRGGCFVFYYGDRLGEFPCGHIPVPAQHPGIGIVDDADDNDVSGQGQ